MKTVSVGVDAAFKSGNIPLLVLVEMEFSGGTTRACNAGYNFVWGGHTWIGVGNLGKIGAIQEGKDLQMYGCSLELSGIPPEMVAIALNNEYQGNPATIWFAPLDENYTILADPIIVFKGRMDTMPIELGETATIQLTIESRLVDWERPRISRYNDVDQQKLHPGDKGLEFIAQMVEKELVWGGS